jgi:hypothetical protein
LFIFFLSAASISSISSSAVFLAGGGCDVRALLLLLLLDLQHMRTQAAQTRMQQLAILAADETCDYACGGSD